MPGQRFSADSMHAPGTSSDAPSAPGNRRLNAFGSSVFAEITRLAQAHNAVNLGQGFPNFDGPDTIMAAAACHFRQAGVHQYAPPQGLAELRAAVADHHRRFWKLDYDAELEVTITTGATEGLASCLLGLLNHNDRVLVFAPYYESYPACIALAGAQPIVCALPDPDFRITRELLDAYSGLGLRALVLNSPHNPTGRVFDTEELSIIADFCIREDLWVLSDEVYEHLVYDGEHVSIASLPGMFERTIKLSSASKTFSVTGWRVGYACAPKSLTQCLRRAHQFTTFCVPAPLQLAVADALQLQEDYFTALADDYRRRRTMLADGLARMDLEVIQPAGAYFILTDIRSLGYDDDVAFCQNLVEHRGVAAIPCSVFYPPEMSARHLVRWAFCKTDDVLEEALERLADLGSLNDAAIRRK